MYNASMPVCRGSSWSISMAMMTSRAGARWRTSSASSARVVYALVSCALFGTWALPPRARANDFEEFEAARSAYEAQDYTRSARLFDALGGGETPALTNRSLLLESKKYLGASYSFLGKSQLAESEFERLLRLDPQYMLDPLGFPEEVQRLFAHVKSRLDNEQRVAAEERHREQEQQARLQNERETQERKRWEQLATLAATERLQEKRSRWVALMPFGIGQVQNGHGSLGAVLAVSEGSLLLISFVSWLVHENLRGQEPKADQRDEFNLTERVSRYTNQVSLGLFGVIALTGIIDAQLRFQGDVERVRKRPLPTDLREPPKVSLGPRGLSLQLRF
jgi:tetratricopeptide (TPR) repeat protein